MTDPTIAQAVETIQAPNLTGQPGIAHAFFSRRGGVSRGIYAGLNCGQGSRDDGIAVRENKDRAMRALGLSGDCLALVHQVHSPNVWSVDRPRAREEMVKADALVVTRPGIAVGVLAADCAPVLFADPTAGVVAAAHSGWRGAVGGVLDNTVAAMEKAGAKRENIRAALGPCIRQASYEVGDDLRGAFLKESEANAVHFAQGERAGHWQFDLAGFILARLGGLGLGSVADVALDTYPAPDRFFSYRRATHKGEPDYGRELSAIALREG